eukprot:XP_001692464.1 predicted protein [Chlamydomonas reinhardtii]
MADAGVSAALGSGSAAAAAAAGSPASLEATQALAAAAAANLAAVISSDKRKPAGGGGAGGNPQRAPPPDAMAGGFIPDTDPITRLSHLPTAVAVLQRSGTPGGNSMGAGRGGAGAGLRVAAGLASRLAAGGAAAGARPSGGGGTSAVLAAAAAAAAAARAAAEEDAMLAEAEMPSDIELALVSLRTDFRAHAACAGLPPLALRSQLAAAGLRDRGSLEQQLDEQRQAGRVRLFRLPTGKDEFGILLTSDYKDIVWRAADEAAAAAAATAAAVSLLLHLGCLGRHTDGDADAYVLAVPGAGKVVKSIADGRRELLMWLSKRQHQEAQEKTVRCAGQAMATAA